jgi:hypothetical protein
VPGPLRDMGSAIDPVGLLGHQTGIASRASRSGATTSWRTILPQAAFELVHTRALLWAQFRLVEEVSTGCCFHGHDDRSAALVVRADRERRRPLLVCVYDTTGAIGGAQLPTTLPGSFALVAGSTRVCLNPSTTTPTVRMEASWPVTPTRARVGP